MSTLRQSVDFFPNEQPKNYIQALYQQHIPGLDSDWNVNSSFFYEHIRKVWKTLVGDKFFKDSYKIIEAITTSNNFQITSSAELGVDALGIVGGYNVFLDNTQTVTYSNQKYGNGLISGVGINLIRDYSQNFNPNELIGFRISIIDGFSANQIYTIIANTSNSYTVGTNPISSGTGTGDAYEILPPLLNTPTSGDRTDLVYLDVFTRIVDQFIDSSIINVTFGIETAQRLQVKSIARVVENTTVLPSSPLGHAYVPLATIDRLNNNPTIINSMITDLRAVIEFNALSDAILQFSKFFLFTQYLGNKTVFKDKDGELFVTRPSALNYQVDTGSGNYDGQVVTNLITQILNPDPPSTIDVGVWNNTFLTGTLGENHTVNSMQITLDKTPIKDNGIFLAGAFNINVDAIFFNNTTVAVIDPTNYTVDLGTGFTTFTAGVSNGDSVDAFYVYWAPRIDLLVLTDTNTIIFVNGTPADLPVEPVTSHIILASVRVMFTEVNAPVDKRKFLYGFRYGEFGNLLPKSWIQLDPNFPEALHGLEIKEDNSADAISIGDRLKSLRLGEGQQVRNGYGIDVRRYQEGTTIFHTATVSGTPTGNTIIISVGNVNIKSGHRIFKTDDPTIFTAIQSVNGTSLIVDDITGFNNTDFVSIQNAGEVFEIFPAYGGVNPDPIDHRGLAFQLALGSISSFQTATILTITQETPTTQRLTTSGIVNFLAVGDSWVRTSPPINYGNVIRTYGFNEFAILNPPEILNVGDSIDITSIRAYHVTKNVAESLDDFPLTLTNSVLPRNTIRVIGIGVNATNTDADIVGVTSIADAITALTPFGGGRIFLGPGTYTSALTIPSGVSIHIFGHKDAVIQVDTNLPNITVTGGNLQIDGNGFIIRRTAVSANFDGIRIDTMNQFMIIDNVVFENLNSANLVAAIRFNEELNDTIGITKITNCYSRIVSGSAFFKGIYYQTMQTSGAFLDRVPDWFANNIFELHTASGNGIYIRARHTTALNPQQVSRANHAFICNNSIRGINSTDNNIFLEASHNTVGASLNNVNLYSNIGNGRIKIASDPAGSSVGFTRLINNAFREIDINDSPKTDLTQSNQFETITNGSFTTKYKELFAMPYYHTGTTSFEVINLAFNGQISFVFPIPIEAYQVKHLWLITLDGNATHTVQIRGWSRALGQTLNPADFTVIFDLVLSGNYTRSDIASYFGSTLTPGQIITILIDNQEGATNLGVVGMLVQYI